MAAMASGLVTIDQITPTADATATFARRHWFLILAALLFAVGPFVELVRREWASPQGAAGPLVLASGIWLLWREARGLSSKPGLTWIAMLLAVPIAAGYILANVVSLLWLSWLCTYSGLVVLLYACIGGRSLARLWFPLAYLLSLVPPPFGLIDPITRTRRLWLSVTAADTLSALGFDTAYNGTMLYIDQYELTIAAACAGMNSQFTLIAVGLFYVYVVRRAEWRYALILAALSIPIAVIANLARILLLMLGIHYLGADAVAPDSVLHESAGLFMFLVSLLCLIGLDFSLTSIRQRRSAP